MRPNIRSVGDQTPTQQATKRACTIAEAADLLGLTSEAVRMRLKRATLAGEKRDGHWLVWLDATQQRRVDAPTIDQTADPTPTEQSTKRYQTAVGSDTALLEQIRSESAFLRGLVEQRDQALDELHRQTAAERQRFDIIHREALQRIEAITAGGPTRPNTPPDDETPAAAPQETPQNAPGRAEAAATEDQPLHQPSHVWAFVRRLIGR